MCSHSRLSRPTSPDQTCRQHLFWWLAGLTLLAGCYDSRTDAELLRQAKFLLAKKDFDKAEALALRIPDTSEDRVSALLIAGEAATKAGRFPQAIKLYMNAGGDLATADQQLAVFSAAEIHLETGQLIEAERLYRDVLQRQPDNGMTNWRLAFILAITNRRWEAVGHFFELTRGGTANYRELGMGADVDRQLRQPDFLEKCQRRNPTGPLVRLAIATEAFREGQADAEQQIRAALIDSPVALAAEMMLGELLLKRNAKEEFHSWLNQLPPTADAEPDIWYVRGLWARQERKLDIAADCFWEAIVRAPQHRRAYAALAQVLRALDSPDADNVRAYADTLVRISQQVDKVLVSNGENLTAIRRVAELMENAGRIWDACAWAVVARQSNPQLEWPHTFLDRLGPRLTRDLPMVDPAMTPLGGRTPGDVPGLSELLAEATKSDVSTPTGKRQPKVIEKQIRFTEYPLKSFKYENGRATNGEGFRQFEQTGGGVAVIDADGDSKPDLFLSQGLKWPIGHNAPPPSESIVDTLFRNRQGTDFVDATRTALANRAGKLRDAGFGQGCSAGDFDNDGFQDLYIANAGTNRLLRNLGDGTFEDVTQAAGITDGNWTASSLICDLNFDGLPDIMDINYLAGHDVYRKVCGKRACSPAAFEGCSDSVSLNQGDGRFNSISALTPREDAKGLGAVAFRSEAGLVTVFVANDQVANFCFQFSIDTDSAEGIKITEEAFIKGVAFNDYGLPLACMGVVAEDFNGDNSLDLFVTNFQDEANTMYLQDASGLFVDSTRALNLYTGSLPYTSWGTQTLDADLDGRSDLVIGNGHVDDARAFGGDYLQQPQFFHNHGAQFEALDSKIIGPWFAGEYLCRGLAKMDWNGDGRMDFAVSRIDETAAVLTNTSTTGNFLNVCLKGTILDRDSFGAVVTLTVDERRITKHVTAGDGYMASNERLIQFGLGQSDTVDTLQVTWPSGSTLTYSAPAINATYILCEGITTGTQVIDGRMASVKFENGGTRP